MNSLKLFAIIVPVFLVIDFLWLGVVMKSFYNEELGDLARRSGGALAPRWIAAILVYVLIPAGMVLFVRPLLSSGATWWHAAGWGMTYGLVVYGVYELTNRALIEKWSLRMTLIDIAWGCVLCGLTSVVMWVANGWLNRS